MKTSMLHHSVKAVVHGVLGCNEILLNTHATQFILFLQEWLPSQQDAPAGPSLPCSVLPADVLI